jgi:predicted Zn-dependent protease
VGFASAAGYDPYAAPRILGALGAAEALDATVQGRKAQTLPSWASSHPLSQDRVTKTTAQARALRPGAAAAATPGTRASHERFLAAIDGMTYGDDVKQGVVDGQRFRHPGLRLQFTAPAGYAIQNGASEVAVSGQGGEARFGGGAYSGDLGAYVGQVLGKLAGSTAGAPVDNLRTGTSGGFPVALATTRGSDSQGTPLDVTVFAYRWNAGTAYHFVVLTPAGSGLGAFDGMVRSLAPLSAAEAASLHGHAIRVATATARDSVQTMAARMDVPNHAIEVFLTLNGLTPTSVLRAGDKVKLVVAGR